MASADKLMDLAVGVSGDALRVVNEVLLHLTSLRTLTEREEKQSTARLLRMIRRQRPEIAMEACRVIDGIKDELFPHKVRRRTRTSG